MKELFGETAESLIRSQIAAHSEGITKALAPFDVRSAVTGWLDTIRAIEEFINLPLYAILCQGAAQGRSSRRTPSWQVWSFKGATRSCESVSGCDRQSSSAAFSQIQSFRPSFAA